MFRNLMGIGLAAVALGLGGLAEPPAMTLQGGESATILQFPQQADLWDAAIGRDGRVHVVYSVKSTDGVKRGASDLFYLATTDASCAQWSRPIAVPSGELTVTVGGERKACIAVLPDGAVLISWPSGGLIGGARSTDGGITWTAVSPRDPEAPGHADTMTMSDGRTGRVAVAWTDTAAVGRGDDKLAAPVHVALSSDGGLTFAPALAINESLLGACVCCTPDVAFDDAGDLWVAYRSSESNVKETCVVRVVPDGAINGTIASHDDWHLVGCPMNGPQLAVSGDGQTVSVTWTRGNVIRGAVSKDGGHSFGEVRDLGRGRMHNGAAAGNHLWTVWEQSGNVALASATGEGDAESLRVSPLSMLLVTPEGRAVLVSDSESSETPPQETPHH